MTTGWLEDYINYLRFEKRYSVHTVSSYRKDLSQLTEYIKAQFDIDEVSAIMHFHLRSWLASLRDEGLTATSINRKISAANSFFKYLLRLQLVAANPVARIHSLKKPERLPVFLKEKETQFLFGEIQFDEGFRGFTEQLICELLYTTGIRRAELVGLKEQDVEWSLQQIRVLGKGNKERLIPVSASTMQQLKLYVKEKRNLKDADRKSLFILESGKPIYDGYVYRTVKKYLSIATTLHKKSPHILRHTFATHLLGNGANIQAIKELLGHSSLAATQVYTHNDIERLKEIHKLSHPRS